MRVLHGGICILYEIYDCILQYVQFAANSHNFYTNINFKLLILTMSYASIIVPPISTKAALLIELKYE